jgi:hypothetical protein
MLDKLCRSCGKSKESADFHVRKASKDGLSAKCKLCQREYDRARLKDPKRMKARRDYQKTENGKAAHSKACKKWVDKNRIKRAAHIMVGNAIRSGKLMSKPCEICGDNDSHGHHDDYALPLSVRWLCDNHHNEWHRINGEGKNAS